MFNDTHYDGQSDIVDYRAAYFAAKNYLKFMDIKCRPSFTVRRQLVVELMVVVIGKKVPTMKSFWGKTINNE